MTHADEAIWTELVRAYFALCDLGELRPHDFADLPARLAGPIADLSVAIEALDEETDLHDAPHPFAFRAATRLQATRGALTALAEIAAEPRHRDGDPRSLAALAQTVRDVAEQGRDGLCALGRGLLVQHARDLPSEIAAGERLPMEGYDQVFAHTRIDDALDAMADALAA